MSIPAGTLPSKPKLLPSLVPLAAHGTNSCVRRRTLFPCPRPPTVVGGSGHIRASPSSSRLLLLHPVRVSGQNDMPGLQLQGLLDLLQTSPPTWESAIASNLLIFVVGSPLLLAGLSGPGIAAAFTLGVLTWRAFGSAGFFLVATYFVIGTAATKLKIAQKEAQGIAEKRSGRRGPASVIGSSAAGCACALLSLYAGVGGGEVFRRLCELGFVASFCTKLSDTVSSEVGKAYGRTTYLITNFQVVPRGTEGAVSVEGTVAGLLAAVVLAGGGYLLGEVDMTGAVVAVVASQIANVGESIIGSVFQEKEGFRWLNNDVVNVINISVGSILAVLMRQILV